MVRLALFASCLLPLVALAQWQWIDLAGRRVYSDLAPPSSVPEKNILKRPPGSAPAAEPITSPQPVPPNASAGKAGVLDRLVADQQQKAEQSQSALRKAEQARQASRAEAGKLAELTAQAIRVYFARQLEQVPVG